MDRARDSDMWGVRKQDRSRDWSGLTTDQVRQALFERSLSVEDWARKSGAAPWRQIGTIDEFSSTVSGSRERRRRGMTEEEDFDMTPMIDVTFLLLIFFMITASFHFQKGLDFPPDRTEEPSPSEPLLGLADFDDRLIVEIQQTDRMFLKDSQDPTAPGTPVGADELGAMLETKSQQEGKAKLLIVAHELASHDAVVKVIDSAARAGISDVALADIASAPTSSGGAVIKRGKP